MLALGPGGSPAWALTLERLLPSASHEQCVRLADEVPSVSSDPAKLLSLLHLPRAELSCSGLPIRDTRRATSSCHHCQLWFQLKVLLDLVRSCAHSDDPLGDPLFHCSQVECYLKHEQWVTASNWWHSEWPCHHKERGERPSPVLPKSVHGTAQHCSSAR